MTIHTTYKGKTEDKRRSAIIGLENFFLLIYSAVYHRFQLLSFERPLSVLFYYASPNGYVENDSRLSQLTQHITDWNKR